MFYTKRYEKSLTQTFGDTAKIYWQPKWRAAYTKQDDKGIMYTYVPLTPKIRLNKSLRWHGDLRTDGAQRFILIKQVGSEVTFCLATYISFASKDHSSQAAATLSIKFSNFSGILTLKNLSTGEHSFTTYKEGIPTNKRLPQPASNSTQTVTQSSNYCEYVYQYTCYWYTSCSPYDPYNGRMTITSGLGGCEEPGYEPCYDWGRSWSLYDTEVDIQCIWVNDPPPSPSDPPSSGDYGDGYNYGGTTTFEIIANECDGLNVMVNRQAVTGGLETGAYYTTDGYMILLPTVGNTPTSVNISFPYKDAQGRIIISGPYQNNTGSWSIDVIDYNTGSANGRSYNISYFVHSHPVGGNYDSNNPSSEDISNASLYPNMRHAIVNEGYIIDYGPNGFISSVPNTCR